MSSKFRNALLRMFKISTSPEHMRRPSTLTNTTSSSSLSTSSLRRRASSILLHRPIEVFTRRNSLRFSNKRRDSTSRTFQRKENELKYTSNNRTSNRKFSESISSRRSSEISSRRFSELSNNSIYSRREIGDNVSRKSSRASGKYGTDVYKELHQEAVMEEDYNDVLINPPPSPLPSNPSHSPTICSLINNIHHNEEETITIENTKKVSFSETVFHWEVDNSKIYIPDEEQKLHSWRTNALFSRKSKLKNQDATIKSRSCSSFVQNPKNTIYENQNSNTVLASNLSEDEFVSSESVKEEFTN